MIFLKTTKGTRLSDTQYQPDQENTAAWKPQDAEIMGKSERDQS